MDWLSKLPPLRRERAKRLLGFRQQALEMRQDGLIDRPTARRIVTVINRTIERLSEEGAVREYTPCKRPDPTAWEAIGHVMREERRAERSRGHARV